MKQLSLTPTINGSVTAAILHSRRTKLKKMAPNLIKLAAGGVDSTVENFCSLPFALEDHKLTISGHTILSDVPSNIIVTPYGGGKGVNVPGCFIGFDSDGPKSHHVVSLGKLVGIKFMSIFRFKVWWTTLWVGDKGSDLEHETQIALLDRSESGRPYVLLLPLIEGRFRASLQPGDNENVDLCVESSSTLVVNDSFRSSLYVHAGNDPYVLIKDAIKVVREFLGTFKLLDEKTPPAIVDKFGWCTWDAFYLKVHPQGVWDGVKGLAAGGCPPGMVLIDDGWQSICHDDDPITDQEGMNRTSAGEQMPCRLIKFQENYKFRDYESPFDGEKGMAKFTRDLKNTFKTVDHIYVWHALCGYWGGIRPGVPEMPEATVIEPKLTPGLKMTMEDLAVDKIVNNGVGLVPPEKASQMYEGLHSHLKDVGIDGVKVDVIHLLEMLCENYGGRVELAKTYYKAISESVKKYLHGNGVIASMEHCNDFMFLGTETISLGRVGDDFWCTDPSGDPNGTFWLQGCHMVHCAYNSLWMGNFIHPDWDMFQSTHPCAIFHAASRAISGGPIYISDSVGEHDFPLIKSLALPDGTILRCDYYALPTRDCLFEDPLHDGKTMLKIWNLNEFTGVVGAFNCQGGGWSREARRNKCASEFSKPVSSTINPKDVEWTNGKKPISIEGVEQFAAFSFLSQQLVLLNPTEIIPISLKPFHFELFTISPIKSLPFKPIQFAPIGLINMLNSGGAIKSLKYGDSVSIEVRGTGEMRVFSSEKPKSCTIDGEEVAFDYDNKMVVIQVPWNSVSSGISVIDYLY